MYDADYRDNVAMIRRELEADYPTLHLVGRNGMHKYNNQDHAMMTAMLTVRNILAGNACTTFGMSMRMPSTMNPAVLMPKKL